MLSQSKVIINGIEYPVVPAVVEGNTPLSAYMLNKMQSDLLEEAQKSQEQYHKEIIAEETSIITLPFWYKVGANMLRVLHNGQQLSQASTFEGLDGYWLPISAENEIAIEGTWSNKIQCNNGWTWITGVICEVYGKGVLENEPSAL